MYQINKIWVLVSAIALCACTLQPKPQSSSVPSVPTNAPLVTATPTVTPTASPSATPTPTMKVSATVRPTTKPTVATTSKTVNPIRFEPSSIKLTKKRSELGNLPAVHVYYPGTHTVSIMPIEGTTGIWASIFPNTNTAEGTVTDIGIVNIHFENVFDRGIKSGVNKETLALKNGGLLEALNSDVTLAKLYVEITISD